MTITPGVYLLWKILNIVGVILSVFYLSRLNQKMIKRSFILPLAFGCFWMLIAEMTQQVLYFNFGQVPWAARLAELIGLVCLLLSGLKLTLADEFNPVWKFLQYLDRLAARD